jgi:hypothetical protein
MFVGKVRSLPYRGVPERCFTQVSSDQIHKHWTRLESPARNKHACLLGLFMSYEENKVLRMRPLFIRLDTLSRNFFEYNLTKVLKIEKDNFCYNLL